MHGKELGLTKSETGIKFICVSAKIYAIITADSEIKRLKGVKKNTVAKDISIQDFENCLFNHKLITCNQNCIRSKNHVLYTVCEHKLALSSYDDKRYLIPNSTDSLPYGHYSLKKRN